MVEFELEWEIISLEKGQAATTAINYPYMLDNEAMRDLYSIASKSLGELDYKGWKRKDGLEFLKGMDRIQSL